MNHARMETDRLMVALVDVQPYFVRSMYGDSEPLLIRCEQLLMLAQSHDVPCLVTLEEPVDRKGQLPDRLQNRLPPATRIATKHSYDLTAEPEIAAWLGTQQRSQFVVAGGETDVCVLQSVLGLIDLGHQVFVLEDCLFSSEHHTEAASYRMRAAGAIPTTYKSMFYELNRSEPPGQGADQLLGTETYSWIAPEALPPRT